MFVITNLVETRFGKLILNHFIGINCPEFRRGVADSYFFKLTLGSDCLDFCSWSVAFKTILTCESKFCKLIINIYYNKNKRLQSFESLYGLVCITFAKISFILKP